MASVHQETTATLWRRAWGRGRPRCIVSFMIVVDELFLLLQLLLLPPTSSDKKRSRIDIGLYRLCELNIGMEMNPPHLNQNRIGIGEARPEYE